MSRQIFTPGRTELAGNHTDHQNGRILASAVDFGLYADVEAIDGKSAVISSEGFTPFEVNIEQTAIRPTEFGTPTALVRGVISAFRQYGLNVGAFTARIRSTLTAGSGLSSSAAFSVMIAKILSELFNGGTVPPIVLARTAQQAEKEYFGKPCGLMDQIACAFGHPVYVDFKTNEIEAIEANFAEMGLTLCLTNTGGSHAGLDSSYARIPADMIYIANLFDKGLLADVDPAEFYAKNWDASNRPVRRAMHFFAENERVPRMRDALKARDGAAYMKLMNESGRSSEELLNNIVTSVSNDKKLADGLELSAKLLDGKGAWRVHGGGFAGCVQALMPSDYFDYYKQEMEKVFGAGSCSVVNLV